MANVGEKVRAELVKRQLALVGSINNKAQMLEAIEYADAILAQIQYGLSEEWIALSRRTAKRVISRLTERDVWGEMTDDFTLLLI